MYLLIVMLYCHIRDVTTSVGILLAQTQTFPHRCCRHSPQKMKFNDGESSFVNQSSIAVVFQKILSQFQEDIGWMD